MAKKKAKKVGWMCLVDGAGAYFGDTRDAAIAAARAVLGDKLDHVTHTVTAL